MTHRTDTFKLFYGATGDRRKELVKAISRILNADAHYEGAPSFNYTIDYVTVDRDGTVSFDARADSDEIERLIDGLAEAGFEPEGSTTETETVEIEPHAETEASTAATEPHAEPEQPDGEQTADETEPHADEAHAGDNKAEQHDGEQTADEAEPTADEPHAGNDETGETEPPSGEPITAEVSHAEGTGLTISIPKGADFTVTAETNLKDLLAAKGYLIKKALGAARLDFETDEESIIFPWWDEMPSNWDLTAFMVFLTAIIGMAKKLHRINGGTRTAENEKYAFRCFLLRLGFIGDEYKAVRKVLLKNLTGSSAFRMPAE